MLLRLLGVSVIALGLAACATDGMGTATAGTSSGAIGVQNIGVFLNKLDAARGQALPAADRLAIGGMAAETKNALDTAQGTLVDKVGAVTGLGGDAVRAIVPSAAAPVSDSKLVGGLETKLGRKLPDADARVITAANAVRNNSLATLKDGFAQKVGDRTGVGKDTVAALMPLLGL